MPAVIELNSLTGTNGFQINGEVAGDLSGRSVSSAGDVNGDGFDDLIIGALWGRSEWRLFWRVLCGVWRGIGLCGRSEPIHAERQQRISNQWRGGE
ncbi:MAG: FG-GAP repeat protein [Cypionkella sp.]|nr:FG-GAP repeat protein [Cypionkella sp.]